MRQRNETAVLGIGIGNVVSTFQLDADGIVVAPFAPAKRGNAGMPRAMIEGDELDDFTVAPDQRVRGDAHVLDLAKVGMPGSVEPIGEKIDNAGPAELPRRQADAVHHQQIDGRTGWAGVAVGRRTRLRVA